MPTQDRTVSLRQLAEELDVDIDAVAARAEKTLSVGVPREVKDGELRVALSPGLVAKLTGTGRKVLVEAGAGAGAGHSDQEYLDVGAEIVDVERVWECELVVKVKEPQPSEHRHLRRDLALFCYLHLAAEPELCAALESGGTTAYAFEDLRQDGRLPLLAPMSQVAGRVAGIVGPQLLSRVWGGRGVLPGGVEGAAPARACVVGCGVAGAAAAESLSALGMHVIGVDVDPARLAALLEAGVIADAALPGEVSDRHIIDCDLLVGAALTPGLRAPQVVSEETVAAMRPGAVIVDIAIDQGGCIATSRPTSHSAPTFTRHGVIHYCVPNMPGQYPITATAALSSALEGPLLRLAAALERGEKDDLNGALAASGGTILPR